MISIQPISESQFQQLEGVRQIVAHDSSGQFALLDLGESLGSYGLAWKSDKLEPIVVASATQNAVWIGVEQQLAAISLKTGQIFVRLPFCTYIVQILSLPEVTAVLAEEEVVLFNPGGSIRFSDNLPDQGVEMSVVGENIAIALLEGDTLQINHQTGYFKSPVPVLG
jgi:hypothetical protein